MILNNKLLALFILDQILNIVVADMALFWSAGRIDWWPAWTVLSLWLVWFFTLDILILRQNPDLVAKRLLPANGAKNWDRAGVSPIRLTELGRPFCRTRPALWLDHLQVVRIQSDWGHTVVMGGPFCFVRHPGYLGAILSELALSTLLASWWAILAGGVCVKLQIIRTALEGRTLQAELRGYVDYARQVRYRFLPGIW